MSIKIDDLCKNYGEQTIFHHYNACFADNSVTCIMGPSGCGKTTLVRILAGLEKKDAGTIEGIEGTLQAVVFQEDRLCEHLSVKMNLRLVCATNVTDEELETQLQAVGLVGTLDKRVSHLSGGMKRRVAIVRALIAEHDILIMDEPFKGLDEELKQLVITHVRKKSKGKIVLIVLHDTQEVTALCPDQVLHLENLKKR